MARNEEKQLARLNRLYLKQQHDEELKKRPPRPKLEILTSADDVKKWLPTIMRDIDFYVKQMEVPCYTKSKIEEFESRIDHLRGEYKAFLRKLYQLEPDLKTTPWSDRPYMGKHKRVEDCHTCYESENNATKPEVQCGDKDVPQINSKSLKNFIPVPTPVLKNDSFYQNCYGFEKSKMPSLNEVEIPLQNEPLQFDFEKTPLACVQWKDCDAIINCKKLKHNPQLDVTNEYCAYKGKSVQSHSAANRVNCAHKKIAVKNITHVQYLDTKLVSKDVENANCSTDELYTRPEDQEYSNKFTENCIYQSNVIIANSEPKDNVIQGTSENGLEISVLGTLNIPYTDSSSSDEET